jgi:sodium-dependent dicarboxylate transporter 2/3/5
VCWALLVFVVFPASSHLGEGADGMLRQRLVDLGPLRGGEARVVGLFLLTAIAWFMRERKELGSVVVPGLVDLFPRLSDAAIGIAAAVLLFVIPGRTRDGNRRPLLTWTEARQIPWDILLFFGAGLTLAQATEAQGLTAWFGSGLDRLGGLPPMVIYLGLAGTVLLLSELASNLAVATMTMPIAAALGHSVGQSPAVMMLVAGFAASTGFALPIATPPNAIVFGSGMVSVRQMARAGILLDIISVFIVALAVVLLAPLVLSP